MNYKKTTIHQLLLEQKYKENYLKQYLVINLKNV